MENKNKRTYYKEVKAACMAVSWGLIGGLTLLNAVMGKWEIVLWQALTLFWMSFQFWTDWQWGKTLVEWRDTLNFTGEMMNKLEELLLKEGKPKNHL